MSQGGMPLQKTERSAALSGVPQTSSPPSVSASKASATQRMSIVQPSQSPPSVRPSPNQLSQNYPANDGLSSAASNTFVPVSPTQPGPRNPGGGLIIETIMSQPEQDESLNKLKEWACQVDQEFARPAIEQKYVEITRLPKKIEVNSLRSLVITAARIRPRSSEICFKNQIDRAMEQVAIVEFNSQQEAYLAVERLRSSPFTKNWITKVMTNPRFVNPEAELINKWIN